MAPSSAPSADFASASAEVTTSEVTSQASPQVPPRKAPTRFLRGLLAPMHYRDYRLLFLGQLISGIGDGFYVVALPWLLLSSSGGAQALGLVMGAYGVTRALTTIAGGWLSDHIRPRRVMLVADLGRMFLVAGLAFAAATGHTQLGILCALTAGLGIFSGAFIPASFAITPDILPGEVLGAGNSLSGTYVYLASLIGPVLAGAVIAYGGTSQALAIDAVSFLVSTATLWAMRQAPQRDPAATVGEATSETSEAAAKSTEAPLSFWRFVAGSRLFQVVLLVIVAINLVLGGVIEVGLPALAHGPLHAGANGYGIMLGVWGAGALVGGLAGAGVTRLPHQGILNLTTWVLQGIAIISLPITGGLTGALISLALMGLCNGVGNVTAITMIQRQLPRALMGRMMGAISFGNFGLAPISVVVAGFTVARYGPGPVLVVGGALSSLVMILAAIPRDMREL